MPEDESFVCDVWHQNDRIVESTNGSEIVVIFGSYATNKDDARGEDGRLRKFNAGFVVQNGIRMRNQAGFPFFVKTLMPKYRMFDDERHYLSLAKFAIERKVKLKDLLTPFTVTIRDQSLRIGPMICEDMWDGDYPQKPGRILAKHGVDLLVNISCSPWGWQKNRARHKAVKALSSYTKVPFIYVNNAKVQNNGKNFLVFDGATTVHNEHGDVVRYLPPYFEGVVDVLVLQQMPKVEYEESGDVAQLCQGIMYGLSGYFHTIPKSMHKVVIGLSGGVDSAVVSALMVHILGKENVIGINMPYGDYNSEETRDNARETAERLGIEYHVMPIDSLVNAQAAMQSTKPGTSQFKTIQAIARMTVLAAHASSVGGIFTCNGNKTEIAFGYYTLNGDGRGSIAPLGDLLKGEVYQLAHYLNTVVYKKEVIPRAVMDVEPMDELGPQGSGVRKDPFDYGRVTKDGTFVRGYHDAMVQAFVGWRLNPEWFLEHYAQGDLEEKLLLAPGKIKTLFGRTDYFIEDLERCWNLFHHATWKRVQSVPNVLVSKRAFGWDYRESVLEPHYTDRYGNLKEELIVLELW
jgi:NAD+ synthase (glutamine-hydrolysing)